jgi:hypothetical protein
MAAFTLLLLLRQLLCGTHGFLTTSHLCREQTTSRGSTTMHM